MYQKIDKEFLDREYDILVEIMRLLVEGKFCMCLL